MTTTRAILADSILDIEAGRWTCNTLLDQDSGDTKPTGCALGLVGINAGLATKTDRGYWVMDYPEDAERVGTPWPQEALDAVQALAETTQFPNLASEVSDGAEAQVIAYNDGDYYVPDDGEDETTEGERLTPEQAHAWFIRALAKVEAKQHDLVTDA